MKVKLSFTKAEEDEKDLRRFAMAALKYAIEAKMRNKKYPIEIDIAVSALQYEYEQTRKSKKRSKFLKWFFNEHLKGQK